MKFGFSDILGVFLQFIDKLYIFFVSRQYVVLVYFYNNIN